jgi:hypothetical protein
MIVFLNKKASKEDIEQAKEEFGDYIKITIDIEEKVLAIGGELHADAEELLIKRGSKQINIWGGGLDLVSDRIDTQAVINLRPRQGNDSMEILNPEIRRKFIKIVQTILI